MITVFLLGFVAMLAWWRPWTVLAGNPVLDPATSQTATATSLPTPMPLWTSCDTGFSGGMWMCRGGIEFTTSSGQTVATTVLLPDAVRRACLAQASADPEPPDCTGVQIRYQASDPTRVALVEGNPGQFQRLAAFVALLAFPCAAVALAGVIQLSLAFVGVAAVWRSGPGRT